MIHSICYETECKNAMWCNDCEFHLATKSMSLRMKIADITIHVVLAEFSETDIQAINYSLMFSVRIRRLKQIFHPTVATDATGQKQWKRIPWAEIHHCLQ